MIVLVCGGRDFDDVDFLEIRLDELHEKYNFTKLVHGGARGADVLAGDWAFSREVPRKVYRANWEMYRNSAGPIRNQQMLDSENIGLVVAFAGGRGTQDMTIRAKKAGIKVIEVK